MCAYVETVSLDVLGVWEFLVGFICGSPLWAPGGMDGITHLIACHYMGITNVDEHEIKYLSQPVWGSN